MIENNTYPDLIEWVPQYLFRQGKDKFVELGNITTVKKYGFSLVIKKINPYVTGLHPSSFIF